MNIETILRRGIIAAALISGLLIAIIFGANANAQDFEPGTLAFWRGHKVSIILNENSFIKVDSQRFEDRCPNIETLWQHADVIGVNGKAYTSTPRDGGGAASTMSSRIESGTWTTLIIIEPDISKEEIEVNMSDLEDTSYDWFMYIGQQMDLIFSCGLKTKHRDLWKRIKELLGGRFSHCVNYALESAGYHDPEAAPYKFVEKVRRGEVPGWSVVGVYEIVDNELIEVSK